MATPFPTVPASTCALCTSAPFSEKAGAGCVGCPAFKDTHYFPYTEGSDCADVLVVGEAPQAPRLFLAVDQSRPRFRETHHAGFREAGARVVAEALRETFAQPEYVGLRPRFAYAARCTVDGLSKAVATACKPNLVAEVNRLDARRRALGYTRPLVVLACGMNVWHAFGLPIRKEAEGLGRVFEGVTYGDTTLTVVTTRTFSAYAGAVGKYNTLLADVERAARCAKGLAVTRLSREEVAQGHRVPRSKEELEELITLVANYSGDSEVHPDDWSVAADTETNTLHPQWGELQLLGVSFSWAPGQAAFIPVDHPETPYDANYAVALLRALFLRRKKWIWHNGKYDQKVLWHRLALPMVLLGIPGWDTMLCEHLLEEAKPKEYGLKSLVRRFLPELSGYEDQLHDTLEARDGVVEGAVSVQTTRKRTVQLPEAVAKALEHAIAAKLLKSANFRSSSVEKALQKPKLKPEDKAALEIIQRAHAAGEFSGKAQAEQAKQKKRMGGFEATPLKELSFYACVDADVTRRICMIQRARMRAEDQALEQARIAVESEQAVERQMGITPEYAVLRLCERDDPQLAILREFKLPRQVELAKIEYLGVKVDRDYLAWGAKQLDYVIEATSQQIFKIAGEEFALTPRKVAAHLFYGGPGFIHPDPDHAREIAEKFPEDVRYVNGRITYRPQHFTATKQVQTSEEVLKTLVSMYACPMSNLLLSYKKAVKASTSTFGNVEKLSAMFGDSMLHGGYNATGTATDRLSSSSGVEGIGFNYQNISKGLIGALRNTRGKLILNDEGVPVFEGVNCKKLFTPDNDSMCFGNADAKGAEVTIFGTYASYFPGGDALVNALVAGLDPHCFFGSEALNPALVAAGLTGDERRLALERAGIDDDHDWSYEDFFTREKIKKKGVGKGDFNDPKTWEWPDTVRYALALDALRDNIKRVVFGMLFGAGIHKISQIAGIPLELAQKIKDLLFSKFPSIPTYMEHTRWEVRKFGVVETFHGGRRRLPIDVRRIAKELLSRFERQAINFKIQRTNSDIVLLVLCWIAEVLERDMGGRVLLTVHDSIGFQVPKKYAHQIPDLFMELGTKRVAKECPWLKSPYRWDVALGPNYGEYEKAASYIAGLPKALPKEELDGYTREEVFDDLRDHEEFTLGDKSKSVT